MLYGREEKQGAAVERHKVVEALAIEIEYAQNALSGKEKQRYIMGIEAVAYRLGALEALEAEVYWADK